VRLSCIKVCNAASTAASAAAAAAAAAAVLRITYNVFLFVYSDIL